MQIYNFLEKSVAHLNPCGGKPVIRRWPTAQSQISSSITHKSQHSIHTQQKCDVAL